MQPEQPDLTTPAPAGPGLLTHPDDYPAPASNCDAGTPVEDEGADHD